MSIFILGLILFLGIHLLAAVFRKQRASLIERLGAGLYRGLYSVVSLAGFVMIIMGWPDADATALYVTPPFFRHITYALMAVAMILLVAAYAPAGRIAAAVKHPMLAGVKIWAFAHLLVNGEVRSILLFGAFLVFAVGDRIAVKRRNAPTPVAGPVRNDIIAIVIGLAAYALIALTLHRSIAGVALF
ncbi:MAG: NnrU family protein [Alphaproteobacteria bacterium]|nr:NnrU family protein [Alphaproteobacteria bacterium]